MNKRIVLMLTGMVIVNMLACTAQPVTLPSTPTATATASITPVITDEQPFRLRGHKEE